MGAYAALLSLSHTLDRIFILDQYPLRFNKKKLVSLQESVTALMKFLEDYSRKYRGVVSPLETRIIDAAFQAEDIVETGLLTPWPSAFKNMMLSFLSLCYNDDFSEVLQEINSILEDGKNDQAENITMLDLSHDSVTFTPAPSDVNSTVGFDHYFMEIKDQMYRNSSTFQVLPIFGMGGIGKTTLATRLYDDSSKRQWFDRRIWIVVSQDYSLRKILLGILQSIEKLPSNEEKLPDGDLLTMVHQELFGKRYLIVADDVWSEEAWDTLNSVLPKNNKGSQVLVTTRLQSVATYVGSLSSSPLEIQLLSEDQSWKLLVDRVFGKESCPSQLEKVGVEIATCCRGLPLMIVVVAGLLKDNITEAYWRRALNMINSSARSDLVDHCSKVLSLSYDHLPLYLKPCFLIVTAFQEDYEVDANQLVRLWMAEGFVRETELKCLEEVAEGYLSDLVGRSLLIVVSGKNYRVVKVHDSLRDMGVLKAREGRFYHDGDSWRLENKERRVTTHNVRPDDISISQGTTIRTYLYTGKDSNLSDSFQCNRLLRVLYSPGNGFEVKPRRMVLLRYVKIRCPHPPKLLFKLQNLETLDIIVSFEYDGIKCIPLKIWKMPFLRHVHIPIGLHLEQPGMFGTVKETNLQTLSSVTNLNITPQVIKMLANLRKLDLNYKNMGFWLRWRLRLDDLVHLQKLEELRISSSEDGLDWESIWSSGLKLPISLKKLELSSINVPWEYINRVVGVLPNLEYFKMFLGPNGMRWNPVEGQFLKLKHLELSHLFNFKIWGAESRHFPSLETLVLFRVRHLQEIPAGIGEIDALKLIELGGCAESLVESAKQIQEYQQDMMGNEQLQIIVHGQGR